MFGILIDNMSNNIYKQENGEISGALVASVVLGMVVLVFGSIMIWALVNYNDQKNNVDSKIQSAVTDAEKNQKDKDQKEFDEKEKNPLKDFVGPNDLGRVTFQYPKTWSVYVDSDGSNSSDYKAFFHPGEVPPTQGQNKFALRVTISNQSYDQILQQYSSLVKQGQLRSSTLSANGYNGQRLDGNFTADLEGSVALFKIRDKSLILATDSPSFRPDFTDKVIKTLGFTQ